MAKEFTNIDDLLRKTNNEEAAEEIESSGVPANECLTADEFVKQVVTPIQELQADAKKSVKAVKFNNVTYEPDADGMVSFNQMVDSDSYAIRVASTISGDRNIKVGDAFVVPIRYMALKVTPLGDRINYRDVAGTLTVARRKEGATEWTDVYTQNNIVSQDETYDAGSAASYPLSLDLGKYLEEGAQNIRIRIASYYKDENDVQRDFSGDLILSVNAVNLVVTNLTDWSKRILASDGGFPFSFSVMGAVDKQLHVQMTGSLGTWTMTPKTFLASEQRPEANPYSWTQQEISAYGLLSHGVHTVTAWLTCSDGMGGELSSEVIVNRFMVVNTSSATTEQLAKPYLMLQGVQSVVENYVRTVISSFAVWKAKSAAEPTVADTDTMPVSIRITNAGDGDTDYTQAYYVSEQKVAVGTKYDIDTTIEIENATSGEAPASYQAYLRIFRYNGSELVNFLRESQGNRFVVFTVDNKNDYSPVAGAHFYLDPKVRNNTEENFQTIVNKQTQEIVPSTWDGFDGLSDGWTTDDDGVKVLRIPSGRTLTIGYEPFEGFKTNPSAAMSLEMEFAVRNITAEDDPVINISQTIQSTLEKLGIIIRPLSGAIWAQEKQNEDDQDFGYEEDKRVHLVLTLTPALIAKGSDEFTWQTPNGTPTNRATAKIYINGKPQRAVQYSVETSGVWIQGEGHGGIRLGNPDCDLDIYTIRCYRGTTLSAQNVLQNYTATRPDADTKNAIRQRNDILDGNGRVSYTKVKAKGKRCLTLVGTDNYKMNQDKKVGYACYWRIDYYDNNGNYVPELSGTIAKAAYDAYVAGTLGSAKCLMNTAQGSTANTYWWNNEQTKCDKVTFRITILFSTLHKDFGWKASMSNFTDDTPASNPLYLDGKQIQGDAVESLSDLELARLQIDVLDGWIDGNGMYHGQFYTSVIGGPKATKLVNKINYASPMQSHKMGATRLYNDIMKAVCKDELPDWFADGKARFAVYEDSYFFFNQPAGASEPIFVGFGTFGSGKCDKATWGYDKKKMFAFEGLNNNLPLCDFRVPADENVTYNADDEAWGYNGIKSFELSLGATNDDGTPIAKNDALFRRYVNFIYAHDTRIECYRGSRTEFDKYYADTYDRATAVGAADEDTQRLDTMQTTKYWLRDGEEAFHLLRFDYVSGKFVDAGTWTKDGGYAAGVRNLSTDPITQAAYEQWKASESVGNYNALNTMFRMAIASSFNANCEFFLSKKNHQTHYNVVNFMLAGTDNCSKNTYYTIDIATGKCWLYQDDLDTILPTDNNGRQTKVYFLSRYFDVQDTEAGLKKQKDYEGTASALFNTMEAAWETLDPTALPANMREVLTAMGTLVGANENIDGLTVTQRQTPMGCIHKYFFATQKYFPEVAWAEQQRIRYDWPASWGYESYGNQARGVLAVTQGIGDQLEREMQYMERRMVLVCSYAAWGDFSSGVNTGSTGLTDASAGLQFTPGSGRTGGEYTFDLVPHQYLYPCGVRDRALVNPHTRMIPGRHYAFTVNKADTPIPGDSSVGLAAINYYRSIGNVGNMVVGNNNFTIQGKRMTDFTAEPSQGSTSFAPKQIDVAATNLQHLSLHGVTGGTGTLNLTKANRLHTLDLRGTKYGQVRMPSSPQLTEARFGAELTSLNVTDMPQLETLTLDGYDKLAALSVRNCPLCDTKSLTQGCASAQAQLTSCTIDGIAWNNFAPSTLEYLTGIASVSLAGRIAITDGQNVSASLKMALLRKFGNVDDEQNVLYVSYQFRSVTGVNIVTQRFIIAEKGDYPYDLEIVPSTANNFSGIEWSLTKNNLGVTVDPETGVLHVPAVGEESSNPTADLTVTLDLVTGKTLASTITLKLFNRLPKLGDWAYYNGEFDSVLYPGKKVVGWVYKVTPYGKLPQSLLNEYLKDEQIAAQYNAGKKLYEVLVENCEDLKITSSDGANSFNGLVWGLYPDGSANKGFSTAEIQPVADALATTTGSIFDIPTLTNTGSTGLKNEDGTSSGYTNIKNFNAYDDATDDGFPYWSGNVAANRWDGKKDTANIVAHANSILRQYVAEGLLTDSSGHTIFDYLPTGRDHVVPENNEELADLCVALGNLGGGNRYRQFAYPAAYACALYEPKTNGKPVDGISDQYKQGKWYLQGIGDTVRLYTFFRNSRALTPSDSGTPTADFSDEDNPLRPLEATDARRPCYANLQKRAKEANINCPVSNPTQTNRWSATEYNSYNSWNVNFGSGGIGNNNKYYGLRVRPVVAFNFVL